MSETSSVAMVMPMAGRGARFAREGVSLPKPLVDLGGRPFFWWATQSVARAVPVREMAFVVLEEHVRDFAIDARVHEYFPDAQVVAIPQVTSGAAETARIGIEALRTSGALAVNDSDHAFLCPDLARAANALGRDEDAALLCFASSDPAYSYVRLGETGRVVGTVEKQVASPYAIAGCYMFARPEQFLSLYEEYRRNCPYDELFVSGMYNRLAAGGGRIGKMIAERHVSFGTPEELARIDPAMLDTGPDWLKPRGS